LDHETAQTHDVRIRVTDNANDSVEEVFTITIGDANDAPTDIAVSSQVSVAENTTIETRIANIAVVDADTDPTFRVYAFATNDQRFEVKNGSLFLKPGQVIDFETAASIQVVVTATDETGSVSQLVTVAVTDVSEGSPTTYRGTNGDDTVTTAADFIYGRKGNDIIFATSPNTATVSGAEGNDHIEYTGVGGQMVAYGGDQADTIIGGGNADQLHGEGGDDTISGNGGNDTLSGGDSSDLISGGEGDDAISGQGGNDQIDGGLGDDTLSGGLTSYDVFIFTRSLASGQPPVGWGEDIITDFERGRDHLNLSGSGLTFSSLTIAQQGSDALIVESESQSSVLLLNQNASLLKSSDFYF
jgi:Ca2+-binding RTX toxin-like protein